MAIFESQCAAFFYVTNLLPPLQSFDEDFLRQILGVMHIAHNPVNLAENAFQMRVDETVFKASLNRSARGNRNGIAHRSIRCESRHSLLHMTDVSVGQTWKRIWITTPSIHLSHWQ